MTKARAQDPQVTRGRIVCPVCSAQVVYNGNYQCARYGESCDWALDGNDHNSWWVKRLPEAYAAGYVLHQHHSKAERKAQKTLGACSDCGEQALMRDGVCLNCGSDYDEQMTAADDPSSGPTGWGD